MAGALVGTVFRSTLVGTAAGMINEYLVEKDAFPYVLHDDGMRTLAGAVTGVAFGVLKHYFGPSVAIPVILFALIGVKEGSQKPGQNYKSGIEVLKTCVGFTLVGVMIGYGLHSVPTEFWTGIGDRMRFQ